MWWYHFTKTAKIFRVTLDGVAHGASISCPMLATSRVTQNIIAVLVEWYHHIVLTMSFKLISWFTFIFAVLLHLRIYKPSYSRFCLTFCCHENQDSLLLKFDWHHWIPCPCEPPVRRKHLGDYLTRVIADFVLNSVAMVTELVVVEFVWHHSIAHPRIPLASRKPHRNIFYTSRGIPFLSQISLPWQPGSVRLKFDGHHLIACPEEPPVIRKHLRDISYSSRVIADFVLNCHGNGVGRGRICQTSFNSPTPSTPY